MKLLFAHGWGFDASCWDALAPLLNDWEQVRDDRGYLGPASTPDVTGPCLAITHSYGTMRLLAAPPEGLVGLVAINGFSRFARSGAEPGVSRRVISHMLDAFDRAPNAVLSAFRARCGVEGAAHVLDILAAREDLMTMRDHTSSAAGRTILSLEGGCDHLLDARTRDAQFGGAILTRHVLPDAGHMLPLTHPDWCAAQIRSFVETQGW